MVLKILPPLLFISQWISLQGTEARVSVWHFGVPYSTVWHFQCGTDGALFPVQNHSWSVVTSHRQRLTTDLCMTFHARVEVDASWQVLCSNATYFHFGEKVKTHNCCIWDILISSMNFHSTHRKLHMGIQGHINSTPLCFDEATHNGPAKCTVMANRYKSMFKNLLYPICGSRNILT